MKNRRSIRLKEYDYSQSGAYFATICTQSKECLFGEIVDGQITLNNTGRMIAQEWQELKIRFPNIELGEYVIMPNHFHGIITLNPKIVGAGSSCPDEMMKSSCDGGFVGATLVVAQETINDRAGTRPALTQGTTIGDIVGAFKSITTDQYLNGVNTND
jgi:putative transposase